MKRPFIYCAALFLVVFASMAVFAQSFEATVVGKVTDPTGAAIVGATVTVTEDATGQVQTATTGDNGSYTLLQLHPSTYTIKFESSGFKTYQQKSLVLEATQTARVDVVMKVGAVDESVTVTAEVAAINTDNSKKGETIINAQVEGLPLNGRDFQDLAMLVPGVYPRPDSDDQGQGYSTSGTRTDATNFTLDGVNNRQDRTGGVGVNTSIESIQEFNVSTSSYTAEFGRQAGAQVSVVSKSGTNSIHGSLFDFLRSDIVDAQNYQGGASALRRQQFGGSLGGKIIKDRMFYFASYEGSRMAQSVTADVNAPNADWLGRGQSGVIGDFRDLLAPNSPDITNPTAPLAAGQSSICSAAAYALQQYGSHQCEVGYRIGSGTNNFRLFSQAPGGGINNVIPASMLSPTALAILPYIPAANVAGTLEGYAADGMHYVNQNQFSFKLDYRLNPSDAMYLRWARQSGNEYQPFSSSDNYYPHMGNYAYPRTDTLAFSNTTTINNTTVNEVRLGWYNQHNTTVGQNSDVDYNAMFGIPGVSQGSYWQGFPSIRIDGYPYIGDHQTYPFDYALKNVQASDTLTMVRGKHTIKVGADVARNYYFELGDNYMRGDFRFRGQNSSYSGSATPDAWAFADFLMGLPSTAQRQVNNTPSNLVGWPMGFFAQDDWKPTSSLTLNLGLRYDVFLPFTDTNNNLSNFILSTGQIITPGTQGYPRSLVFTNWRNIAPRVGFAWRVFNDNKTVLRGGGGLFYSQEMYNSVREELAQNYIASIPTSKNWQLYSRNSGVPCEMQLGAASPFCASNPASTNWPSDLQYNTFYGMDPHGRTPQVIQSNLTLEQEIAPDLTWEVGYVGSFGHFLGLRYNANQIQNPYWSCKQSTDPITGSPTGSCSVVGTTVPFPSLLRSNGTTAESLYYQAQTGNSNYNALQTSLRRRARKGLTMLVSYTFSKMIDDGSSSNSTASGTQQYPQNSTNLNGERARSDLNRTHQFTAAMNYALPIGRGQWLASNAGDFTNAILGNWQFNMKGSVLTGRPFTPQYNSADYTSERPNLVGDPMKAGVVMANPDETCHYLAGQVAPDGAQGRAPVSVGGVGGMVFNPCAYARPLLQADVLYQAAGFPAGVSPALPVYGNVARNTLTGPLFFDVDAGLTKSIKVSAISEKAKLQLRIESFNLLNHPNFQIPNYLLDQPNVAQYTRMSGNNRVFQFAAKLLF